jgi:hypothetical protein
MFELLELATLSDSRGRAYCQTPELFIEQRAFAAFDHPESYCFRSQANKQIARNYIFRLGRPCHRRGKRGRLTARSWRNRLSISSNVARAK